MKLSAAQQAAVERSGQDVCVVAGPGSGKTRVLVERFAWLVEQGVSPLRVLAITFTEKAANEIKQRLVTRFESDPTTRAGIERAYVSTIDSFCARLLRENAVAAGLDPEFAILEEATGVVDPLRIAEEALDALLDEQPTVMRGLLEAFAGRDVARDLVSVYGAVRSAGADLNGTLLKAGTGAAGALDRLHMAARTILEGPSDGWKPEQAEYLSVQRDWARGVLAQAVAPNWRECLAAVGAFRCDLRGLKRGNEVYAALSEIKKELLAPLRSAVIAELFTGERELLHQALIRFDALFRARKRSAALLDFADLEERAIGLLSERVDLRARLQQFFDAILMDELQDTNPLQWKLMNLLRRSDRFYAVGDINQSIYGFRHADPEVFRSYRGTLEQRGMAVDALTENYRSRGEILSAVTHFFDKAGGIEPINLTARGTFVEKSEPSVEVIAAFGEDTATAAELEARWVARRIRELEGTLRIGKPGAERVARFSEMAVLVRTAASVEPLAAAFAEFQVPYLQSKGRTFFAAREVLDLMNWLRVLANPRDEVSLAAVLRSPLVGVSDETLVRLKQRGELWDTLNLLNASAKDHNPDDCERLLAARACIKKSRECGASLSPDLLVARVLDESGYLAGLDSRARANIEKFLKMVRDLAASVPGTVSTLAENLDALREEQPEPDAPPVDAGDAVSVMTIHAAKGLEFPVVFLAALHKETNKRQPVLVYREASGLGAQWRDPSNGETVADVAHTAAAEFEKQREAREADRLLFVAMTRAEEHLVLSFAKAKRMSSWAKQVAEKFAVDLETCDNTPVETGAIRILRTDTAPPPMEALNQAAAASEPLEMERPSVSGQHDSTLTATSVALFEACPWKYFLNRYLGWPETRASSYDPGEDAYDAPIDASELGTQVHELLAGNQVENPAPEALELAARFTASELGQRAARATRIEREFDFLCAFDDIVLRGQIDLWFEEGGELILADYKTDRHEDRAEAYALQLRLYALALERIHGPLPDRAVLCYLRTGNEVEVSLDRAALDAARQSVRALVDAQNDLEFPTREGEQCWRCGHYRGACPAATRS